MKVKLEGISRRSYPDKTTGLLKTAIDLHCVRVATPQTEEMRGNAVLTIGADPLIPGLGNLEVGKVYSFEVDTFVSKSGRFAKLVSIEN